MLLRNTSTSSHARARSRLLFHEPPQAGEATFPQLIHGPFWGCLRQVAGILPQKLRLETALPSPPCIQEKEQRAHGSHRPKNPLDFAYSFEAPFTTNSTKGL